MASTAELFFSRIPSDESESDTPEKCRKRRRRRIEMRRMRINSCRLSSPYQFLLPSHRGMQETLPNPQPHSVANNVVANPLPDFGCLSIQGLSRSMGDAVFVKEEFCRPGIVGGRPIHFFAVYDGHGGSHVSTLCKEMMHKIMAEELTRLHISKANASDNDNGCSCRLALSAPGWYQYQIKQVQKEEEWEELLRMGIEKSFERMDEVALSTCGCGCQLMELAFAGSSAVVALLSRRHIMVANCGDSRAVLCRDGRAIPLSLDHNKSESRPNEPERIKAAKGKLIYQNRVGVYGILNMSLSLGDNLLKRVIRSQPEISITKRDHEEDECLILASDGLWDVLSDDLACRVATTCLRDASAATAPPPCSSRYLGRRLIKDGGGQVLSASKFAAAILLRLALARGSHDNISVIVIDLIRNNPNK